MTTYRHKTEIIFDICSSVKEQPRAVTKIMYMSYVSYNQVHEYLAELVAKGLIEFNQQNKLYSLTGKGFRMLDLADEYRKLLKKE